VFVQGQLQGQLVLSIAKKMRVGAGLAPVFECQLAAAVWVVWLMLRKLMH